MSAGEMIHLPPDRSEKFRCGWCGGEETRHARMEGAVRGGGEDAKDVQHDDTGG